MRGRGHGRCRRCNSPNRGWLMWCSYCDTGPYCLGDCIRHHVMKKGCFRGGGPKQRDSQFETHFAVRDTSSIDGSRSSYAHTTQSLHVPEGFPVNNKMSLSLGADFSQIRNTSALQRVSSWCTDHSNEVRDTRAQGTTPWLSSDAAWPCPDAECSASTRPNYSYRKTCRKCGMWKPS